MIEKKYIPLVTVGGVFKIYLKDVVYVESRGRRVLIRTDRETYSKNAKISEVERYLDEGFYKCHRGCVVNIDKIVEMKAQTIIFENKDSIYLCREKFIKAKQFYAGYLIKKAETIQRQGPITV